jgi:glycosyltransferase involved in cell wall biosynthesis
MPSLSIVISFYKRRSIVCQTIESLSCQATQLGIVQDLVIVDSNSDPGLPLFCNNLSLNNINLVIINTVNSLSAKRNFGAMHVVSDYIAFLDDDCVPQSNYLSSIYRLIDCNVSINSIFSGLVRFPRNALATSRYIQFRQSVLDLVPRQLGQKSHYLYSYAMNFLMNGSRFLELGFSEVFKSYGAEDHEFFFRAVSSGFTIYHHDFLVDHCETSNFYAYTSKLYRTGQAFFSLKQFSPLLFKDVAFTRFLIRPRALTPFLYILIPFLFSLVKISAILLDCFDSYFLSFKFFQVYRLLYFLSFVCGFYSCCLSLWASSKNSDFL